MNNIPGIPWWRQALQWLIHGDHQPGRADSQCPSDPGYAQTGIDQIEMFLRDNADLDQENRHGQDSDT